jgi:basic amino acid/polyamine antiporter, APA family
MLLIFVLGDVLGGGIYALVGEVGSEVGGAIWAAFLLALMLALLTAGSYAELTTKYPHAGGAALYAERAFRSPFVAFMVAFAVMASGLTSASALARAIGGDYLAEFVELPVVPVALAFLVAVATLNFRGIVEAVRVNVGLTFVELTGLAMIIAIGVAAVASGGGEPDRALDFREGTSAPLALLAGSALAFYALIGFEDSANLAEETSEPRRAYPRALFGGIVIAGTVYVLVTVTASMVVPTSQLSSSSGPLLEVVKEGPLAVPTRLFAVIGLLAIANGALINMIMASRLLYGMAEEEVVPAALGRVHPTRRTPWVSIVVTTAAALVLAATGDLEPLADTTVLLLLNVFIIVNVAVLVLRREQVEHDHFRVPTMIPFLGIASCALAMTQAEPDAWLRAGVLLVVGLGLWLLNLFTLRRARGR